MVYDNICKKKPNKLFFYMSLCINFKHKSINVTLISWCAVGHDKVLILRCKKDSLKIWISALCFF